MATVAARVFSRHVGKISRQAASPVSGLQSAKSVVLGKQVNGPLLRLNVLSRKLTGLTSNLACAESALGSSRRQGFPAAAIAAAQMLMPECVDPSNCGSSVSTSETGDDDDEVSSPRGRKRTWTN